MRRLIERDSPFGGGAFAARFAPVFWATSSLAAFIDARGAAITIKVCDTTLPTRNAVSPHTLLARRQHTQIGSESSAQARPHSLSVSRGLAHTRAQDLRALGATI